MDSKRNKGRIRRRISPALVVSVAALFLALSGAAVALPGSNTVNSGDVRDNTLKSQDLKDGKVKGVDIKDGNVGSIDVTDNDLTSTDLKDGEAVSGADVVDDSLGSADLGQDSVRASELGAFHTHINATTVAGGVAVNGNYNTASTTATCGAGEQLISSGGYWANGAAGEELFLSEIQPNPAAGTVKVTGGNDAGVNRTLVAVAVCLG